MDVSSLACAVRRGPMSCPFCDKAYKGVRGVKRHLTSCQAAIDAGLDKAAVPEGFVVAKVAADGSTGFLVPEGFVVAKVAADDCTGLKRKANEAGFEEIPARRVSTRRAPAPLILAKPELATDGDKGEERRVVTSAADVGDAEELRMLRERLAAQERRNREMREINLLAFELTKRVMAMSAEGDGGATR